MWPVASTQTSKPHASVRPSSSTPTSATGTRSIWAFAGRRRLSEQRETEQRGREDRRDATRHQVVPPWATSSGVTAPDRRLAPSRKPIACNDARSGPVAHSRGALGHHFPATVPPLAPTYNAAVPRDLHRPLREAWIVEAVRTPIGRYGGALARVRPDDLAAPSIRAVVDRAGDRPGADRGRDPRLREPGRRGRPRRGADGAAPRRAAGRGRRADRQPAVRHLAQAVNPRSTRSRSATATSSSPAGSSR